MDFTLSNFISLPFVTLLSYIWCLFVILFSKGHLTKKPLYKNMTIAIMWAILYFVTSILFHFLIIVKFYYIPLILIFEYISHIYYILFLVRLKCWTFESPRDKAFLFWANTSGFVMPIFYMFFQILHIPEVSYICSSIISGIIILILFYLVQQSWNDTNKWVKATYFLYIGFYSLVIGANLSIVANNVLFYWNIGCNFLLGLVFIKQWKLWKRE